MDEQQVSTSEHAPCEYVGILGESEDSDEEASLKPLSASSAEELSILARLGLNKCEEMTEEEVESAFARFVIGFHCDQYTLNQRLHVEEHDRTVAEENFREALQHTRDALQMLCWRIEGEGDRQIVRRMEESLHSLENNMESIITTAENLGAVHQEARVSHAVEIMALHMESLQKRHTLESAELLQTRQQLLKRARAYSDITDDGEIRQLTGDLRQHVTRRRVSVTLIPTQTQLTDLEMKFLESCRRGEEPDSSIQEGSSLKPCLRRVAFPLDVSSDCSPSLSQVDPIPVPRLHHQGSSHSQDEVPSSDVFPSPLQVTQRRRRRHSALFEYEQSSKKRVELQWGEWHTPGAWSENAHELTSGQIVQEQLPVRADVLESWLSRWRTMALTLLIMCGTCTLLLNLLLYLRASHHYT